MDDPWGSPWAATDSDKDQKLASSSAKSDLAPPPRAFLSASNSPRISAALEQSPWGGDGDGFGQWTAASDTPSAQSGWGGGGWGSSSPSLTPPARDDVFGKASPIAWPGNIATPKLAAANGSAFRQPSPDPWASELSSRRASADGATTPRLIVDPASPVDAPVARTGDEGLGITIETVWKRPDADSAEEQRNTTGEPNCSLPDSTETARAADHSDVRLSVESAAQCHEYQSSTASNDNTDHEEEPRDSSNTSIDEESSVPRPESRKASSKVQELVVKFDGLAQAASQDRPPSRQRSRSPLSVGKGDASDDTGDFGDFEDADPDGPPTPIETSDPGQPGEDLVVAASSPVSSPHSLDRPSTSELLIARFGPLDFAVDLSAIGRLFETAAQEPARRDPSADADVPDHIIRDSFTEISERKTWYRVSRLGSSRRHNAGDDDNYRQVTWPSSTVHDDTIKIVRRWMEEDSIAGRVALGGGVSKTQKNMFGWDSTVEPVALDAVFRKKKSHSRTASLQTSRMAGLSSQGLDGPVKSSRDPAHQLSGSIGQLGASFSWSSGARTSDREVNIPSTMSKQPVPTAAALSNIPAPATPIPNPPRPGITITTQPVMAAGPIQAITSEQREGNANDGGGGDDDDDDDDDEWGEMVSSPVEQKPAASQFQYLNSAFDNTTVPAAQQSVGPPAPTRSETKTHMISGMSHSNTPLTNDAWGSADFSIFESSPAKPSTKAGCSLAVPHSLKPLAKEPIPGSILETPAASSTSGASAPLPDLPELSEMDPSFNNHDSNNDEAARHILANLPDLSYMLR
ncbi:Glucan 1,4-alpha-glucosidase [Madurella fahalii]|uniref:Glucan 1,4-alpha-glucosidase n=1 Tax=Madurella fahalii TaxID=1157608 RepID=A0ABQ0GA40_9PEZI